MSPPAVDGVCNGCGFDYDSGTLADVVATLTGNARAVADTVARGGDAVRIRPDPETWSALEYECHVRDALAAMRGRIALTLAEDTPEYAPMGREELVVERQYNAQDPGVVASELAHEAELFAAAALTLSDHDLRRTGIYSYPASTERPLHWLVRHAGHEVQHHLDDITRGLTKP